MARQAHLVGTWPGFSEPHAMETALKRLAPEEQHAAVATQMPTRSCLAVANAPENTRFGVHLCLGDMKHRALAEMGM